MTATPDPADARLLARLGALAEAADPPPASLYAFGYAALSLRSSDLDLALARLVEDSTLELAGVRGAQEEVRLLSFEGGDLAVDVQLDQRAGRRSLLGQVIPAPPSGSGVVHLETADGTRIRAEVDHLGGFRIPDPPMGSARLVVQDGAGTSTAVATDWVEL